MATLSQLEAAFKKADAAGNVEDARAFAAEIRRMRNETETPEFKTGVGDVVRAAGQGLSFGFGDELAAIAQSAVGDKTYEEAVAEERAKLEAFRSGNAPLAYGLEIAGSIPTSLFGVGLLGRGAQAAGKLIPSALRSAPVAAASTAATEGAIYGAGAAKEGERLAGAGVGGSIGGVLGGSLGAALPKMSKEAKKLISEGVPVTAGQAMGGVPRIMESALGAIPVVKEFVEQAKGRAVTGFTAASMNRALKPLGKSLPKKADLGGTQAFDKALDIISKEYEEVIPSLTVGKAEEMATAVQSGIKDAVENQPTLYGKDLKDFSELVGNIFSKMPKSGKVDGKVLKEIETRLGAAARAKTKAGRADTAFALGDVKAAFRKELARQDETGSKALSKVNEAYKNILPIEKSVNKAIAEGGDFTPKQLMQSMRQQSPRQAAKGKVTDQDFAMAAQQVIGKKSGEGAIAAPLTGLAVGQQALSGNLAPLYQTIGTAGLAAPMYSRAGVPITRGLLSGAGGAARSAVPVTSGLVSGGLLGQE